MMEPQEQEQRQTETVQEPEDQMKQLTPLEQLVLQKLQEEKALSREALVERLVPGKLVYVKLDDGTVAFKLSDMLVKHSDGTFCAYKGEPFSQLHLTVGSAVEVISRDDRPATLVVDPTRQSGNTGVLGGTLRSLFRTG